MPSFKIALFDTLEVEVLLNEEGDIESVTDNAGNELELDDIRFDIGVNRLTNQRVLVDLQTYLRGKIEDCMDDWYAEVREFKQARGRDRVGEE